MNTTVVVGDKGLLLIDTGYSPRAAEWLAGRIRDLTDRPLRYLVYTDGSPLSVLSASVFAERLGDPVEVIAHEEARKQILETTLPYLHDRQQTECCPEMERALVAGLDRDGSPLSDPRRQQLAQAIEANKASLRDLQRARILSPTLTFRDELTLHNGSQVVHLIHPGRGQTAGSIAIHIPHTGLLVAGNLVPQRWSMFREGQLPGAWSRSLARLLELDFDRVVSAHGPVMDGRTSVELQRDVYASLHDQAVAAVADSLDLDEALRVVDLESYREAATGGDEALSETFDEWLLVNGVRRAYEEASQE